MHTLEWVFVIEYQIGTGQTTPLESYEDLNVRIHNKYVKDFGPAIKDNLPKDLPDGIKDIIFNYTVPNKIESKPYWTPVFIESTYAKEQVKKDTFKYLTHSKYGGMYIVSVYLCVVI